MNPRAKTTDTAIVRTALDVVKGDGRAKGTSNYEGNKRFNQVVAQIVAKYQDCPKTKTLEKLKINENIINEIIKEICEPGGRFLLEKSNGPNNVYYELLPLPKIREKIRYALKPRKTSTQIPEPEKEYINGSPTENDQLCGRGRPNEGYYLELITSRQPEYRASSDEAKDGIVHELMELIQRTFRTQDGTEVKRRFLKQEPGSNLYYILTDKLVREKIRRDLCGNKVKDAPQESKQQNTPQWKKRSSEGNATAIQQPRSALEKPAKRAKTLATGHNKSDRARPPSTNLNQNPFVSLEKPEIIEGSTENNGNIVNAPGWQSSAVAQLPLAFRSSRSVSGNLEGNELEGLSPSTYFGRTHFDAAENPKEMFEKALPCPNDVIVVERRTNHMNVVYAASE